MKLDMQLPLLRLSSTFSCRRGPLLVLMSDITAPNLPNLLGRVLAVVGRSLLIFGYCH